MGKQVERFLKNNYESRGPSWCAEKLGLTYRACVIRAYRLGLNRRTKKREDIEIFIRDNYPRFGSKECVSVLGMSAQRARNIACRLGLTGRKKRTRYSESVNAEFFDEWSPEMAYVLGFIYADGGLQKDKLSLYQNEKSHLKRICHVMGMRQRIRPHGKRCHVVSVNNVYMADILRAIGIRESKSFGNMVLPVGIPDTVFHAFFRGFFDGDGSVGVYGKYKSCRVSLYAQENFLRWIFDTTNRLVSLAGGGVSRVTAAKRKDFYACYWSMKDDVRKLYEWMYQDCDNLFLKRKKRVIDGVMATL